MGGAGCTLAASEEFSFFGLFSGYFSSSSFRGGLLSKYRNRLQIIAEILEIVRGGAKKTHIMYGANLSYKLLCKYLGEVLECGLVQVDGEERYSVAPKGEKFLKHFSSYVEQRDHVKKALRQVDEERALLEQMYTNAGGSPKKGKSSERALHVG